MSGIVLVCAMVVIGGTTRLTGSGLSIVEWKPVTGVIPPLNDTDWQMEFDKYKQFPQYQLMNQHMSLTEFKQIYFWEYVHRLLGRITGIAFIIPFAFFYFKRWISKKLLASLTVVLLLGALQGFVGWYMVKSGLNTMPYVSHFRLAFHQGLALLLIAYLVWILLSLDKHKRANIPSRSVWIVSVIAMVLLALQITWGAFVAGLKAGYSYTNFPWVGDSFFPNEYLVTTAPYFHNGVLIQFTHRWLGFLVLLSFAVLYFMAKKDGRIRATSRLLLLAGSVQVMLGIVTLLMSVPILLGVVHQVTAILLLVILVHIIHTQMYTSSSAD
jgi:cytochrome c oxidase assembly protein subunit 15